MSVEPLLTVRVPRAAIATYLHELADRAFSIQAEGVLHEAAELVLVASDRRKFDAPIGGAEVGT